MKNAVFPFIGCGITFLCCISAVQAQQVIVDNLNSENSNNIVLSPSPPGLLAQSFTSGASAFNFLNVTIDANALNNGKLRLAIFDDVAGNPGNNLSGFKAPIPHNGLSEFLNLSSAITPNTKYWVILGNTDTGSTQFSWRDSINTSNTGEGTIGTGTNATKVSFNSGGTWSPVADSFPPGFFGPTESFTLRVEGNSSLTPILPEPGALPLTLFGIGGYIIVVRRRRKP